MNGRELGDMPAHPVADLSAAGLTPRLVNPTTCAPAACGLTKREALAIQFGAALVSNGDIMRGASALNEPLCTTEDILARWAVRFADALLDELAERKT